MKVAMRIQTPCGPLIIAATTEAVTEILFGTILRDGMSWGHSPLLDTAAQEIEEYFAGIRREFTFPIAAEGTPFQQQVWQALRTIPYGQTRTYGQIATQIGRAHACRAVGMANHRNPLPIVIPCHRVIGTSGKLTGYAGGMEMKAYLLALEIR